MINEIKPHTTIILKHSGLFSFSACPSAGLESSKWMTAFLLMSYHRSLVAFLNFCGWTLLISFSFSFWDEESLNEEGIVCRQQEVLLSISRLSWKVSCGSAIPSADCPQSVVLRLRLLKNTLCELEHLSPEMKIMGICANQSGIKRSLCKETGLARGFLGPCSPELGQPPSLGVLSDPLKDLEAPF